MLIPIKFTFLCFLIRVFCSRSCSETVGGLVCTFIYIFKRNMKTLLLLKKEEGKKKKSCHSRFFFMADKPKNMTTMQRGKSARLGLKSFCGCEAAALGRVGSNWFLKVLDRKPEGVILRISPLILISACTFHLIWNIRSVWPQSNFMLDQLVLGALVKLLLVGNHDLSFLVLLVKHRFYFFCLLYSFCFVGLSYCQKKETHIVWSF